MIDTREKRQALASLGLPWIGITVTVNVVHDGEWRQESGYSYPGIVPSGSSPASDGLSPSFQTMVVMMMNG